uniref:Uncharacterized protein n=1 Tax=Takifugu rubripes TaxID=31033 RepID=H2S2M1_TAKRU
MTATVNHPRSSTTTMVVDAKNGDAASPSSRGSKKTFTDDLHSTFSSPLAWILVLALIVTWSCVFVIMFDLTDFRTISGEARRRRGKISSDPVKLVNDAVDESTHMIGAVLKFAANLIAPDEDQGSVFVGIQAKMKKPVVEDVEEEEEEEEEEVEEEEEEEAGEEGEEAVEEVEELQDEEYGEEEEYSEEEDYYDEEDEEEEIEEEAMEYEDEEEAEGVAGVTDEDDEDEGLEQ